MHCCLGREIKMATYVVSDIHGYFYRFQDCLAKVNFNPTEDELIMCGDIIDRGLHNAEMLEWAYNAPSSVKFIMGNHEDMMLATIKDYERFIKSNDVRSREEESYYRYDFAYNNIWTACNGGLKTFEYLMNLPREHREDLLNWIQSWPLFYDITVQGRRFILVHAGLAMNGMRMGDDRYDRGLQTWVDIDDFPTQHSQSLLWIRENWMLDVEDLPCDVVFGHTPSSYTYKIIEDMNDWIKIDGGDPISVWKGKEILHFGKGLKKHCIDTGRKCMSILRLDDMEEFVSDIEE